MAAAHRIESERLILRSLEVNDEETFVSFFTDPDFMQYSRAGAFGHTKAKEVFAKRLARSKEQFNKLAVIEKSSGQLIGYCGVEPCELEGKHELELGYRLKFNSRGRGYATEAARSILHYYEGQGVTNILAFTAYGNTASQRVLKKLGFKAVKDSEIESFPIIIFRR
ncbi:MAG: GNAT family N-acetyltransferase [Cellvibrio sp.]